MITLPPELITLAQGLVGLTPVECAEALDKIPPSQRQAILAAIVEQPLLLATAGSTFEPHEKQIEAQRLLDDPNIMHVLMFGGARSGKSVLGVKTVIERAISAPDSRHLIARYRFNAARNSIWRATLPEVLGSCFPGLEATPNNSEFFYKLANGSEVWVAGLDDRERTEKILGTEFSTALLEECSELSWSAVEMVHSRVAQRRGLPLKIIYSENPPLRTHWSYKAFIDKRQPDPPHRPLANPERWASIKINPIHNARHLGEVYIEGLRSGSARKVSRFYHGDFGEIGEAALWTMEMIEKYRVAVVPDNLVRVVVSVDPSGTSGEVDDGDAVGIVVAGIDQNGFCYIIEDATVKLAPAGWGAMVVSTYERHMADAVIVETNYGGAMCRNVVEAAAANAGARVKVREVTATRGKVVRAEPISALYETGKVVHVGRLEELEAELCDFSTNGYMGERSPNRADAAIWACTHFFGKVTQNPEKRHRDRPRYANVGYSWMKPAHFRRGGGSGR